MNRREFVTRTGAAVTLGLATGTTAHASAGTPGTRVLVRDVDSNFEREPLIPYHFKGSAVKESWQIVAGMQSDSGIVTVGLGNQGVLWSDSKVFAGHSESGGNALMYAMSERALRLVRGTSFTTPMDLLDTLLPEVLEYGKKITRNPDLRKTFALNALVCVDNAAWLLYAREKGITKFDDLIPADFRQGLSYKHEKVASMPSFSVGTAPEKIKAAVDSGFFIMKLKIGSAGTQSEMLEKDKAFVSAVHKAIGHYETPYTKRGKIPYYFDANERYESKDTLARLLDHAKKIGAFEQIAVVEEPLGERNETYVGDLGVTICADESAHTAEDAATRIEQGYGAIAVKAIAKTLSMTMKIAQVAYEKKVPCFCADLTVSPILVDWNKCVAARLTPFPGISVGLLEANGHQYYRNWDTLMQYHPRAGARWTRPENGVFITDQSFYDESGGIFMPSPHYTKLLKDFS